MKKTRMHLLTASVGLAAVALAATGCGGSASSKTEDFPTRPVTILNPYAAGGPTDTTVRAFAACLSDQTGGTFAVENKVGGGGAVAMQELATAKPDGYTVGLSTNGPLVLNPMQNELSYSLDDFRSMGIMAEVPHMFVVPAGSPFKDLESLIQAAREKPGTVTLAMPGATDSPAIELERFKQETGIEFATVPTTGSAEIIPQLLGHHVDAGYVSDYIDAEAQVKAGKIVPLAATAEKRSEAYPDVPTTVELGFDVTTAGVFGLFAPKDVPDEIADAIEAGIETCSKDAQVIERIGNRFVPNEFTDGQGTMAWFDELRTRTKSVLAG